MWATRKGTTIPVEKPESRLSMRHMDLEMLQKMSRQSGLLRNCLSCLQNMTESYDRNFLKKKPVLQIVCNDICKTGFFNPYPSDDNNQNS